MDDLWDEIDDLLLWGDVDLLAELDELVIEDERLKAYWAMRKVNAQKAERIRNRLIFVRTFPIWDMLKHVEPDVFGDHHERFSIARDLIEKQLRIEWILWAMYHYWMFDVAGPGGKGYGNKYSKYRQLWDKYKKRMLRHARSRAKANRRLKREQRKKRKAEVVLGILKAKRGKVDPTEAINNIESTSDLEGILINDPVALYRSLAESVPDILGEGHDIWQ